MAPPVQDTDYVRINKPRARDLASERERKRPRCCETRAFSTI